MNPKVTLQRAPHVHNNDDAKQIKPWLKKVIEDGGLSVGEDIDPREVSLIEKMFCIIGRDFMGRGDSWLKDIKFSFAADMWVRVSVEITYQDGLAEHISTAGDYFLLAMAKTLEHLNMLKKSKQEKFTSGWAPCVHNVEDAEKVKPWLKKVIEEGGSIVGDDLDPREDSLLETILWIIGLEYTGHGASWLKDIKFTFSADRSVTVGVNITYQNDDTAWLLTEGDSFLLAMAKTLECLHTLAKTRKADQFGGSNGSTADCGT